MYLVGPRARRTQHSSVRRTPIVHTQAPKRAGKLGQLGLLPRSRRNEQFTENIDGTHRERREPNVSRRFIETFVQRRDRVRSIG